MCKVLKNRINISELSWWNYNSKGTLAGLAYTHQPVTNLNEPIKFYFLPVDGNNPLIKDLEDEDTQIVNVD